MLCRNESRRASLFTVQLLHTSLLQPPAGYKMSLSNPLNVLLIPPIFYVIYLLIVPSPSLPTRVPHLYSEEHYNWLPDRHPEVACYRKYTVQELNPLNGQNGKEPDGGRILLAIMRTHQGNKLERTVFDVSAGRTFYGPGEPMNQTCQSILQMD